MTDIWLVVRVPVLSEQMTVVQPSVSTDGSFLHRHRQPWAPTNSSTGSKISSAGKQTMLESHRRVSCRRKVQDTSKHRVPLRSDV